MAQDEVQHAPRTVQADAARLQGPVVQAEEPLEDGPGPVVSRDGLACSAEGKCAGPRRLAHSAVARKHKGWIARLFPYVQRGQLVHRDRVVQVAFLELRRGQPGVRRVVAAHIAALRMGKPAEHGQIRPQRLKRG